MNCQNLRDVKMALKSIPKDLNETYTRILLKISERKETAKAAEKILRWLVGSMRHLGLLELEEAIMIEPGTAELNEELRPKGSRTAAVLASCGCLVEVFKDEEALRRVRISHYTVQVSMSYSHLQRRITRLQSRNFFKVEFSPWDVQSSPGTISV